MQIIKNIKNELLKRNEIIVLVEANQNPSFAETRKQISEKFNRSEDNIEVCNILGSFGSKKFKIYAYIYESKAHLDKNKVKTKKQKEAEEKEKTEKTGKNSQKEESDTDKSTENSEE